MEYKNRFQAHVAASPEVVISQLDVFPDGRTLAAGGGDFETNDDAKVVLWNARSGKLKHVLLGLDGAATLPYLAFSPDSRWIAGAGNDWDAGIGSLGIWKVSTGQLKDSAESDYGAGELMFLPACGGKSQLIWADGVLDFKNGYLGKLHLLQESWSRPQIQQRAFSPYGDYVAGVGLSGENTAVLELWNRKSKPPQLQGLKLIMSKEPSTFLEALAFSPKGDLLASGGEDGKVTLWKVR